MANSMKQLMAVIAVLLASFTLALALFTAGNLLAQALSTPNPAVHPERPNNDTSTDQRNSTMDRSSLYHRGTPYEQHWPLGLSLEHHFIPDRYHHVSHMEPPGVK
jgi:hypothetical protein